MKKIRKMYSGVVPNGKVLNSRNDSLQDTYSSDYLNRNIPNTKDLGEIIVDDITCKNLLPNYMQSQTVNGVTITKNNDGSITFNGTSTAAICLTFRINLSLSSGQYTHSIKNAVPTGSYLSLDNIDYTMIRGTTEGNKITFTLTKETTFSQYIIYFDPNITFNNVTIFPQVEKGNETDYVEHKEFSNKQIYSTGEHVVGKWIDGKLVYEKTIIYTHSETIGKLNGMVTIDIPHGISNFEHVVEDVKGFSSTGNLLPLLNGTPSTSQSVNIAFVNTANIQMRIINVQITARTWYLTLRYTKTTD